MDPAFLLFFPFLRTNVCLTLALNRDSCEMFHFAPKESRQFNFPKGLHTLSSPISVKWIYLVHDDREGRGTTLMFPAKTEAKDVSPSCIYLLFLTIFQHRFIIIITRNRAFNISVRGFWWFPYCSSHSTFRCSECCLFMNQFHCTTTFALILKRKPNRSTKSNSSC